VAYVTIGSALVGSGMTTRALPVFDLRKQRETGSGQRLCGRIAAAVTVWLADSLRAMCWRARLRKEWRCLLVTSSRRS
jgi:hypothetical protein